MYRLETNASFDSAHFLKGYQGKCSNIHGHRWKVEVAVAGERLSEEEQTRGMLVDFGNLKADLKALTDYYDHCLIIERNSLKDKTMEALVEEGFRIIQLDFRPTAENFSRMFYNEMEKKATMFMRSEYMKLQTIWQYILNQNSEKQNSIN